MAKLDIGGKWRYEKKTEQVIEIQSNMGNCWWSGDGKTFFQYEHQSGEGKTTFVNVQSFTALGENRLRQELRGYRFDREREEWVHFERVDVLERL